MPHKEESSFVINELHPTFAAEIRGIDFSKEITPDVFNQVYEAITKVRLKTINSIITRLSLRACSMV